MSPNTSSENNLIEPPIELQNFVGGGDFKMVGDFFYQYLINSLHLKPNETILDVGCGCGRIAYPLLDYIKEGKFCGFDIDTPCIDWCKNTLTEYNSSFQFKKVDIYNKRYNPGGKIISSNFTFPYDDDSFDVVILTSVFTHLTDKDMLHYLSEINRVLKVGGKCLITYFLFNELSEPEDKNRRDLSFDHEFGHYRLHNIDEAEHAIAFDEAYIRELFKKNNLDINMPIVYSLQEVIMATKTG